MKNIVSFILLILFFTESVFSQGYDITTKEWRESCLEGVTKFIKRKELQVSNIYEGSGDSRQSDLASAFESKGNWIIVKGSGGEHLTVKLIDKSTSISSHLSIEYVLGDSFFRPTKRPLEINRAICGTHFVTSTRWGALFEIEFNLIFDDKEHKEVVKREMNFESLFGLIKKKKANMTEYFNVSNVREVVVNFRQNANVKISDKKFPFICNKANFRDCVDEVNSILKGISKLQEDELFAVPMHYTMMPIEALD